MDPAQSAFLEQTQRDRADNATVIGLIERGQRLFMDGVDVTLERLADAHRRYADASAILQASR